MNKDNNNSQSMWVLVALYHLQKLLLSVSDFTHSNLTAISICIFLNTDNAEYLFMYLLANCVSVQIICPDFNWSGAFALEMLFIIDSISLVDTKSFYYLLKFVCILVAISLKIATFNLIYEICEHRFIHSILIIF